MPANGKALYLDSSAAELVTYDNRLMNAAGHHNIKTVAPS